MRYLYFSFVLALCFIIQGCGTSNAPEAVVPVAHYSTPVEQEVREWDIFPGRLESPRSVTLSARVSGIITQAPFEEGALVQEGDTLFILDERPLRAAFMSSSAEVARAKSQVSVASANFKRYEKLQGTRAISAENFDEALAALNQARANLSAAEASYEMAKLNLEWTKVTAPISGRVSRKSVTEGNLVNGGAGQATMLTSITSIDPMFVYATVPEEALGQYQALLEKNRKLDANYRIPSAIQLQGEEGFQHTGEVDFIDNQVNPSTGTIQIRAVIPNPQQRLVAGMFARLRVPRSDQYKTLLVPDSAISTDQSSRFVLVITNENVLAYRAVKLGALFGTLRAIGEGLQSTDRVVVAGVQQLRPKMKVSPKETQIDLQHFTSGLDGSGRSHATPVAPIGAPA